MDGTFTERVHYADDVDVHARSGVSRLKIGFIEDVAPSQLVTESYLWSRAELEKSILVSDCFPCSEDLLGEDVHGAYESGVFRHVGIRRRSRAGGHCAVKENSGAAAHAERG